MTTDFARTIPILASLDIAETSAFYVDWLGFGVGYVAALHEEYSTRGVPELSPFLVRPWNMKEFYIHDPHGNLLKFGCGEW